MTRNTWNGPGFSYFERNDVVETLEIKLSKETI
jgi:hypothetical protein